MTYTALFWTACTLIGAFAAAGMLNMPLDQRWGSIYGALAVAAMVGAVWSWEKRQGVQP